MASNSAKEDTDAEFEEFLNEPLTSSEDASSAQQNKMIIEKNADESKGNKWLKRSNATVKYAEEDSSSIPDVTEEELYNMLGEINSAEISLSTPTVTGLYSEDFDQEEEDNTEVAKDDERLSEEEEDSVTMRGEEAVGGLESFQTVIFNDAEVGADVKAAEVKFEDENGAQVTRSFDEIMKEVDVLERLSRMSKSEVSSVSKKKMPQHVELKEKAEENLRSSVDAQLRLQLQEERRQNSKLRAEFFAQETNVKKNLDDLRSAYEDKIFRLQEENIVLSSRLAELGSRTDVGKGGKDEGEVSAKIQVEKVMNAMKEQERILAGFQTENERLYGQVKKLNTQAKEKENFWNDKCTKLQSEISNLKRNRGADDKRHQTSSKVENADAIVAKDMEIAKLTERIEDLQTSHLKMDEYRTKMEELKELFATKHPDSVAALIIAANVSDWDPFEREGHDNSLSRLQDEYLRVKVVYEKRIEDLERKVKDLERENGPNRPHSSFAALEKELDGCRRRHEKEVSALRSQVEMLRNESKKNRNLQSKEICWGNSSPKSKEQRAVCAQSDAEKREQVDFLKGQIEMLQSRLEIADKAKWEISRTRQDNEELMDNLRTAERQERQELENELGRWFAKAADHKTQLDSQEVTINLLREQLSQSRNREEESFELHAQVRRLMEERSLLRQQLRQQNTTPQQERINELKLLLEDLEDKYAEKEDKLRKIRSRDDSRLEKEVLLWKRKVLEKNDEVHRFRGELDGMLKVLEEMRRQGVRVPVTNTMLGYLH